MLVPDARQWSEQTFGACELGDWRRTQRLVKVAAGLAGHMGQSLVKACANEAEMEGAYRLVRNHQVSSAAVAAGGFRATAELAGRYATLLAVEDSTALTYRHAVRAELGPIGKDRHDRGQGLLAHSVLLVNAQSKRTVGLIEQRLWCRSRAAFGQRLQRRRRAYADKESRKWEQASAAMATRLGPLMSRVVSVCDRESDVYEYLHYKVTQGQRFVIRVCRDRCLAETAGHLFEYAGTRRRAGRYTVMIPQKGGRPARVAELALAYAPVTLCPPAKKRTTYPERLPLYLVVCTEVTPGRAEPLCWVILTTELVTSVRAARRVVSYYEQRWKIEEYHKAWKSGGTQVERQRMQRAENLERMAVVLAFVAVRLLQLKESVGEPALAQALPCTPLLTEWQWQVLWRKIERTRLPTAPPSLNWAYYALAQLGGWYDSKRTGKVGWGALWDGWFKLEQMVAGAQLMRSWQA